MPKPMLKFGRCSNITGRGNDCAPYSNLEMELETLKSTVHEQLISTEPIINSHQFIRNFRVCLAFASRFVDVFELGGPGSEALEPRALLGS